LIVSVFREDWGRKWDVKVEEDTNKNGGFGWRGRRNRNPNTDWGQDKHTPP